MTVSHRITVMAAPPAEERISAWAERGFSDPAGYEALAAATEAGDILITYLGGASATGARVSDEVLSGLSGAPVWLQLALLPMEDARYFARSAARLGVLFIHAPYFQDPSVADRPICLVYAPASEADRPRVKALVSAVSSYPQWTDPLNAALWDVPQQPEYALLAEYAITRATERRAA